MLEEVLVVDIVDLDHHVLEGGKQGVVEGHAQDGQDVGDVCLFKGFTPPQRKDTTSVVRQLDSGPAR